MNNKLYIELADAHANLSRIYRELSGADSQSPTIREEESKITYPKKVEAEAIANLITPKQLLMIRALAKEAGVDPNEECMAQLGCKPDELTKRAASSFIDYLKTLHDKPDTPKYICEHGEPAKRIEGTRKSGPHVGEPFIAYACPRDKESKCNYWYWADDEVPMRRAS